MVGRRSIERIWSVRWSVGRSDGRSRWVSWSVGRSVLRSVDRSGSVRRSASRSVSRSGPVVDGRGPSGRSVSRSVFLANRSLYPRRQPAVTYNIGNRCRHVSTGRSNVRPVSCSPSTSWQSFGDCVTRGGGGRGSPEHSIWRRSETDGRSRARGSTAGQACGSPGKRVDWRTGWRAGWHAGIGG